MTPDPPSAALLLVDVINDFDFPGSYALLDFAILSARKIAALRNRMRGNGMPVIYVNDNFGRWRGDFHNQIERCCHSASPGSEVANLLRPAQDDYFVLKPKHSGFHSTSLESLLRHIHIKTLNITGFATDICVIYTANDAYMRDYEIIVPEDCVAAESAELNQISLTHIKNRLKAKVLPSTAIR